MNTFILRNPFILRDSPKICSWKLCTNQSGPACMQFRKLSHSHDAFGDLGRLDGIGYLSITFSAKIHINNYDAPQAKILNCVYQKHPERSNKAIVNLPKLNKITYFSWNFPGYIYFLKSRNRLETYGRLKSTISVWNFRAKQTFLRVELVIIFFLDNPTLIPKETARTPKIFDWIIARIEAKSESTIQQITSEYFFWKQHEFTKNFDFYYKSCL